jgi:hypothetical protein
MNNKFRYEYFLTAIKEHGDKDECLLWPHALNKGYGICNHKKVHRLALEYKLNRPIEPGLFSCHKCVNKHCFNPKHLYEGTQLDNMGDAVVDGTSTFGEKNGMNKKTTAEILEIRDKYATGLFSQQELADEYNLHQASVSQIILRKRWKFLPRSS